MMAAFNAVLGVVTLGVSGVRGVRTWRERRDEGEGSRWGLGIGGLDG